jgi:hypothetical protein
MVESAISSAPTRYAEGGAWSEKFASPILRLAGRDARMQGVELDDLKAGLMRRDEIADRLVRAVREDHVVTMPEVRIALEGGIDAVPNAAAPLVELLSHLEARPEWVDGALLEQGAAAARRIGGDGFDILAFGSLLGGYRSGGALQPLVRTGRIGEETLKRVGETGQWWLAVTSPGGLQRDGQGWKLSVHVRVMHAFVNYQLERDPSWDWDFRGVPINQFDRAGTIGSFSTSYLLQARALGIRNPAADAAAIMHLWSYVGWLMGVEERWLPRTERIGRRVLGNVIAGFSAPEESSRQLGYALIHMHDDAPAISALRRFYERERALSMATFLNLGSGMRDIGQPMRPPWYPLWRIAANTIWTQVIGRLPSGTTLLDRRAERALERMERFQYAGKRPPIAPVPGSLLQAGVLLGQDRDQQALRGDLGEHRADLVSNTGDDHQLAAVQCVERGLGDHVGSDPHKRRQRFVGLLLGEPGCFPETGVDRARAEHGHADAGALELTREALGVGEHEDLAGAVPSLPGQWLEGGGRSNVEDRASAALDHPR